MKHNRRNANDRIFFLQHFDGKLNMVLTSKFCLVKCDLKKKENNNESTVYTQKDKKAFGGQNASDHFTIIRSL